MLIHLFFLFVGIAIGVCFHAALSKEVLVAVADVKAEVAKLTARPAPSKPTPVPPAA